MLWMPYRHFRHTLVAWYLIKHTVVNFTFTIIALSDSKLLYFRKNRDIFLSNFRFEFLTLSFLAVTNVT